MRDGQWGCVVAAVLVAGGCASSVQGTSAAGGDGGVDVAVTDVARDDGAVDVAVAEVVRADRPRVDAGPRRSTQDINGDGFDDVVVSDFLARAVYVFPGGAAGPATTPITLSGPAAFGGSIALVGDVDGDGFDELLVGEDSVNAGYLYAGSAAGLVVPPTILVRRPHRGDTGLGRRVAGAGDVNGDGFADVMGLGLYSARVYLGSATGLTPDPRYLDTTASWNTTAGDFNGDRFTDVLVGNEGHITQLYLGGTRGLRPDAVVLSPDDRGRPDRVVGLGDVNGDGFDDALVGTDGTTVLLLRSGGMTGLSAPSMRLTAPHDSTFSGLVAGAGDVDGDGFDDVVAVIMISGLEQIGFYFGGPDGLAATPTLLARPDGFGGAFVSGLAAAGDVNGDGFGDLVAGAPSYGRAYVYLGSAAGLVSAPVALTNPTMMRVFGWSIASARQTPEAVRSCSVLPGAPPPIAYSRRMLPDRAPRPSRWQPTPA